jgi:hypothetical protein
MAPDRISILSHALYKIQINRITIQQIAQHVQAIQINHLRAAAILLEQLHGAVIQRDHHHAAAPTALLRVIQEVRAHQLQALTLPQVAVAAAAVTVAVALVAQEVVVQVAVHQVAAQAAVHQVAAEDNRLNE